MNKSIIYVNKIQEKKMKKLLTVFIVAMLVVTSAIMLVACDGDAVDNITSGTPSGDTESGDIDSGDNTDEPQISVTGISVDGDILEDNVLSKGTAINGLEFVIHYSDGSKSKPAAVDASMISGYDKDKTGYQTVKVSFEVYEFAFEVLVADVVISDATGLENAIKAQKDGQVWAILAGEYDIAPDEETVVEGETGWYFAITADNLSIYGVDKPIITSSVTSANGNWSKQNLITVFGDNVVIDGVNIVSKVDVNKIIEVVGGDNFVLSDSEMNPPFDNPKFAGSIYFNEYAGKTATVKNVKMNYARITTSGCDSTSTINLDNVYIDFAGAYDKYFEEEGYSTESYYWAIFNTTEAKINAVSTTITVSEGASKHNEYKSWFLDYLPEEGIEIKIVEVWNEENSVKVSDGNEFLAAVETSKNYGYYTITLMSDIVVDKSSTVEEGKELVVDLNGKKVTVTEQFQSRLFANYGTLTIKGNGTVDVSNAGNKGYGTVNNFGKLTVIDGTYIGLKEANASNFYNRNGGTADFYNATVYGGAGCIATEQNTETSINGGYYFDELYPAIENRGNMLITAGEFVNTSCSSCSPNWGYTIRSGESSSTAYLKIQGENEDSVKVSGVQGGLAVIGGTADIYNGYYETVACEVHTSGASSYYAGYFTGESYETSTTIYGGTFKSCTKTAVLVGNGNPAPDSGNGEESTVIILGGTFIGGDAGKTGIQVSNQQYAIGAARISGGNFSSDPQAYLVDGFTTKRSEDGMFEVVAA